VVDWRNASGRPLASPEWLEAHHIAKLAERRRFAEMLAQLEPQRVIDLGCGTGLWLELLDEVLPTACKLVGVDSDRDALALAEERSNRWQRAVTFEELDLESDLARVPEGDMTLAFNVFQYLKDAARLVVAIADKGGALVVRQYDGAALRFGPMESRLRNSIETSLRASVASSDQFRHYDLDRVYTLLETAPFHHRKIDFELFSRTTPFADGFIPYYEATLAWMLDLLSEDAAQALQAWLAARDSGRYFFEVDLTAVLS
jgi:SAM-dependent methyltransferase